jgi:hypothetical protein
MITSHSVLLKMRKVSDEICRENQNTYFTFNNPPYFDRVVHEMCENIVKPDRPQMTIWCLRIACWLPKATNTPSEYITLTAFPLQQWLRERASMLCYMYVDRLACVLGFALYPCSRKSKT